MQINHEQTTVLLVEDDPGHARLIEKNMRRLNIANDMITITDGQSAVDFLFNRGKYANTQRPKHLIVLLDLNLPILNGYEILKQIKGSDETRRIPVIVLTTTEDSHEIARCYKLGCNVFITKPVDYEKFADAIEKLGLFLSIVAVPNGL